MKTVEQVRRARLAMLLEEFGSYAALNKLMGRVSTDSTLSQIANQSAGTKTGKAKDMGSSTARKLELATQRPLGWMDTDPDLVTNLWPFESLDPEKIANLRDADLSKIEGAALLMAAQIGLDIAKTKPAGDSSDLPTGTHPP